MSLEALSVAFMLCVNKIHFIVFYYGLKVLLKLFNDVETHENLQMNVMTTRTMVSFIVFSSDAACWIYFRPLQKWNALELLINKLLSSTLNMILK